ncbi:helix-turn-helix transcriptional regulator [Microbulbifer celer]|uniref:Helix-turn-helix transcriptional regulator n=1 Tax=Microbulbifer celer TaxID=435905 RepID=A0ABW3UDB7_9GAMM|nr:AraC family transcriptional regulator [Microbulbifer celer]UFN56010.1 AraC family transcriptional regulator [Microbulbifer celer]
MFSVTNNDTRGANFLPLMFRREIIAHLLLSSENFDEWLCRYLLYQDLICPALLVQQDVKGDDVNLYFLAPDPLSTSSAPHRECQFQLIKDWLMCWARLGEMFGDGAPPFRRVELALPLSSLEFKRSLRQRLGCDVRFVSGGTRVVIPVEFLRKSVNSTDPLVAELLSALSKRVLEKLEPQSLLVEKIYRIMASHAGAIPTMEIMAGKLFKSVRTLRRHLRGDGVNYQELVVNYRIAVAKCYLLDTNLPANEIARLVNYADSSNFYRVFRYTEGVTPSQYRNRASLNTVDDLSVL